MLKGKMEIELKNVKTGEVQHITEDNMFTKALYYYMNENYGGFIFNDITAVNNVNVNDMFPLVERGLGGLMLLPETEIEDEENLYPHSFPTAVAVQGREDYGTNRMMGLYNTTESGEIENGFKFVYEFMTTQGNGTIACACLTNKGPWNYNTTDTLSKSHYNITNNQGGFRKYKYTYINSNYMVDEVSLVGIVNGKLYAITGLNENNKYDITEPKLKLYDTNIVITGCDKVTDISIATFNDTANSIINNGKWISQISIPYDYSEFSSRVYSSDEPILIKAFPYTENKAIIFVSIQTRSAKSSSGIQGADGWVDCYIIDLVTYDISFLRTITFPYIENDEIVIPTQGERIERTSSNIYNLCWDICKRDQDGYGWFEYPNLVYYPSRWDGNNRITNKYHIVKINVVDGTIDVYDMGDRKNNDNGHTMHQLFPQRNLIGFDQRVLNLDTGRYKDISSMRIANYGNGGMKYYLFTNKLMGIICDNYNFRDYYAFGRNLTYMATINNLSTPITKTSEQTMKVTYTIMNAEG